MTTSTRDHARCKGLDVGIEDHGIFVMHGSFEGDGWGQGFGHHINEKFIRAMMAVFNVDRVRNMNGRPCWVTHSNSAIHKIEPLFEKDGIAFDVDEWVRSTRAGE